MSSQNQEAQEERTFLEYDGPKILMGRENPALAAGMCDKVTFVPPPAKIVIIDRIRLWSSLPCRFVITGLSAEPQYLITANVTTIIEPDKPCLLLPDETLQVEAANHNSNELHCSFLAEGEILF